LKKYRNALGGPDKAEIVSSTCLPGELRSSDEQGRMYMLVP